MRKLNINVSQKYSKTLQKELLVLAITNFDIFNELVELLFSDNYRVIQNVAGVIAKIAQKKPSWLEIHLERLIQLIEEPNCQVAIKRNVFRLFQFVKIEENLQGRVIKRAFEFIIDKKEAIAVRAFAIETLKIISKDFPELRIETKLVLEDDSLVHSAGLKYKKKNL